MKRHLFRACLLFFLSVSLLFLSACGEGLAAGLGFDTHDYAGEPVKTVHDPLGQVAAELSDFVSVLSLEAPILQSFSGAKEAAEAYRDQILSDMLSRYYARYAGNQKLLAEAALAYPGMQLHVLIPAKDFESVVYATFGGSEKIVNRDGARFLYLEKIRAYTTAAPLPEGGVRTTVLRLEETERTYRLYFENQRGEVESPAYFALLIKRDDGSFYIAELREET